MALVAALGLGACGGKGGTPEPAEKASSVAGRVRVAGSTPLERVLIEPEEPEATGVEVSGDLRPELKRLTGARIEASGTFSASGRFVVSEYTTLEISGHVPTVGVLEVEGNSARVVTDEGERLLLQGPPAELLALDGAKVWVVLDSSGSVTGYGIIRER